MTARPDQFHDADLVQLLGQQGVERVDDQRAAQDGDQAAQSAEYTYDGQDRAGHGMFAGKFFVHAINAALAVFDVFLDPHGDLGDVRRVVAVTGYRDIELVKIAVQPKVAQRFHTDEQIVG